MTGSHDEVIQYLVLHKLNSKMNSWHPPFVFYCPSALISLFPLNSLICPYWVDDYWRCFSGVCRLNSSFRFPKSTIAASPLGEHHLIIFCWSILSPCLSSKPGYEGWGWRVKIVSPCLCHMLTLNNCLSYKPISFSHNWDLGFYKTKTSSVLCLSLQVNCCLYKVTEYDHSTANTCTAAGNVS